MTCASTLNKAIEDWINDVGTPIISAAYDIAVARHMMELNEINIFLYYLGHTGAIYEIEQSTKVGYLSRRESSRLIKRIKKIISDANNVFNDAWFRSSLDYELRQIQIFLDTRHYSSFISFLNNSRDKKPFKETGIP